MTADKVDFLFDEFVWYSWWRTPGHRQVLHHFYIIKRCFDGRPRRILWNSLTQNEVHRRHCSLFSIERQFPKLDVAGSIPVWTAGAHPENKVGPALATLSIRVL